MVQLRGKSAEIISEFLDCKQYSVIDGTVIRSLAGISPNFNWPVISLYMLVGTSLTRMLHSHQEQFEGQDNTVPSNSVLKAFHFRCHVFLQFT